MSQNRVRCGCCEGENTPCVHNGVESNCPDEFTLTINVPAVEVEDTCDCTFSSNAWSYDITLTKSQDPWKPCYWIGVATPNCATNNHCVEPRTTGNPDLSCLNADTIYKGITGLDLVPLPCWTAQSWGGCDCLVRDGGVCQSDGTDVVTRDSVYLLHSFGGKGTSFEYWCGACSHQIPTTPCNASNEVGDPACADGVCCEHCGECADQEERSTSAYSASGTFLKAVLWWNHYYGRFMLSIDVRGSRVWSGASANCDGEWGTPYYSTTDCLNMCVDGTGECDTFSSSADIYSPFFDHYDGAIWWNTSQNCPNLDPYSLVQSYPTRTVWTFDPSVIIPTACNELSGKNQGSAEVSIAQNYCMGVSSCGTEDRRLGYFGKCEPFEVTWSFA